METENKPWEDLSYEEKNHELFLRQKALLDEFLEHGAISQAQHDKSLHDLIERMAGEDHNPANLLMKLLSQIESVATESGIYQFGYVDLDRLKYSDDVRKICEGNSCRNYGRSWACPPAVGTLEECRARMEQYRKMLLFTKKYDVESSFDFEAMAEGLQDFQRTVDTFHHGLEPVLSGFLLLSNEGCARCAKCTYPDEPCRFPNLLHHSLEGYGFVVNELAAEAGIKYNNGPNTVTFFGALVFNP